MKDLKESFFAITISTLGIVVLFIAILAISSVFGWVGVSVADTLMSYACVVVLIICIIMLIVAITDVVVETFKKEKK